jgi:hypothetical protein
LWNYRLTVVVAVPYITVNICNYLRLVVMVTDNLTGFILSKVGCGDLGIYFSNKLSP